MAKTTEIDTKTHLATKEVSFMVAGVGLEPHDLRVMSPTSYQLLYPAILSFRMK